MKKSILILFIISLIYVTFGCVTIEFDNTGVSDPVSMNDASLKGKNYDVVDEIRKREKALFLFGIFNIRQPDLEGDLKRAVKKGDEIVNLKLKSQYRLSDFAIGVLTMGIIIPRTIIMEAEVVKILE